MKRLLCFGDSNTFGYDPRSCFGSRYPSDVRWTSLLQGMGWEVANCGQNGLCIPREPQFPALTALLRSIEPAFVTVMLGSNDLLNGSSPEDAVAHMETLLRRMAEDRAGAHIILIAPPPMQPGDWVQSPALVRSSARLAPLYRTCAQKCGVSFADAGAWNVALTFDGVHFSPEGHAAFAAGLAVRLSEIVNAEECASAAETVSCAEAAQ